MSLACTHCLPREKYCLHLTRFLTQREKSLFLKYVNLFKENIGKQHDDPSLKEKLVLIHWEVYLLLDFFTSNGPKLRCADPSPDVILANCHSAYDNSVSQLAPFSVQQLKQLRLWKGRYQYGFFDYGYVERQDQDSQQLAAFCLDDLLILLHFFAMYGSLLRCLDDDDYNDK
jgi:hypothetical protein